MEDIWVLRESVHHGREQCDFGVVGARDGVPIWQCRKCGHQVPVPTAAAPTRPCRVPGMARGVCQHAGPVVRIVHGDWVGCRAKDVQLLECRQLGELVVERRRSPEAVRLLHAIDERFAGRSCDTCEHHTPARHHKPPVTEPPTLTLACADCVDPELAAEALAISRERVPACRTVLFAHVRPANLADGIDWVQIAPLESVDAYNLWVLRELWQHIHTTHVLTIQTDGFVIDADQWDPEWLKLDYLGAPWKVGFRVASRSRVGNSGICLRSVALLRRLAMLATEQRMRLHHVVYRRMLDDAVACRDLYYDLIAEGYRWGTVEQASRFAFERQTPERDSPDGCFGFHGRHTDETRWMCEQLVERMPKRVHVVDRPWENDNVAFRLPEHGMISPQHQRIIQIDITNACPKRCSNCTRFVAHQRQSFFMGRETFAAACESMQGYAGMVGIMGGEPTIHHDFAWITAHVRDTVGQGVRYGHTRSPIEDFASHRQAHLASLHHRVGLWTSLGRGYYRHFEAIQDTYGYQCINDHSHPGLHQALLVSYRDLGIDREEFERRRDDCWVQRLWSASITPHGAYFCEVAAAIDNLLYEGRHAWPIEAGWWRREPADFGDQLSLCDHCSACLDVPRRPATDEIEDVSQSNLVHLQAVGSPAVRRSRVAIVTESAATCRPSSEWYMEQPGGPVENLRRVAPTNRSIYPMSLDGIVVCVDRADVLRRTLPHNRRHFDRLAVVTTSNDLETQRLAQQHDCTLVVSDRCYSEEESFNKGKLLNDAFAALNPRDWVLNLDADIYLPPSLRGWLDGHVLNPGCLYYTSRYHATSDRDCDSLERTWTHVRRLSMRDRLADQMPWGYFQLWHPSSEAVRGRQPFSESFPTAGGIDNHFQRQWDAAKRVRIDDASRSLGCVHIWHGDFAAGWSGSRANGRTWEMVGQTNPVTGRFWTRLPLTYPVDALLVRLDTAERQELTLSDAGTLEAMVCDGVQFDLYQRVYA